MGWAEHAACMGERTDVYRALGRNPEADNLKDLVVDRMIILKSFFKKENWDVDVIDLAQDRDRWQALEHGYEI
jgi:hypothetical protein